MTDERQNPPAPDDRPETPDDRPDAPAPEAQSEIAPRERGTTIRNEASMKGLVWPAVLSSFRKLDPRDVARNPVMFVVEVGSVITTYYFVAGLIHSRGDTAFVGAVSGWLWFTVLFANFATAMAEGRGKAQADALRRMRTETYANLVTDDGIKQVPAAELRKGHLVMVSAGEIIPGDGEVIEGIASVDESAITGESAPVIRESGGDRSAVTGGTKVLSDQVECRSPRTRARASSIA